MLTLIIVAVALFCVAVGATMVYDHGKAKSEERAKRYAALDAVRPHALPKKKNETKQVERTIQDLIKEVQSRKITTKPVRRVVKPGKTKIGYHKPDELPESYSLEDLKNMVDGKKK